MIKTTDEYKILMGDIIRAPTEIRAELQLVTPDVEDQVSYEFSGGESFSTNISDGHKVDYITMEPNYFKLDGTQVILPSDNQDVLPNGLVSEINGITLLTVYFQETVNLRGLSIRYNNPNIESYWVTVQFWNRQEIMYIDTLEVKGDWVYFDRTITQDVFRVIIMTERVGQRRTRLVEVVLGEVFHITPSNIISSRQDIEYNHISTELFDNRIAMNVYDDEKRFHPDNPDGLWDLLKPSEKINIYYGIQDIEFLRNTLYLTEAKRINDNVLQISASSYLATLTEQWTHGHLNSHSLSDLAQELADYLGKSLVLDLDFDKTSIIPLPTIPINQCFQIIANALCARLYMDYEDNIVITNKNLVETDMVMDFTTMFEKPELDLKSQVKEVQVSVYDLVQEENDIVIYDSGTLTASDGFEIDVPYPQMGNAYWTMFPYVGSNVSFDDNSSYFDAYHSHIKLVGSGAFRLQVTLQPITTNKSIVTVPVSEDGEVCVIDNPLVDSVEWAEQLGQHVADFYKHNKVYEVPVRQDYSMETGDIIEFTDSLGNLHPGLISRLQFNAPGQTGAMEIRRWD